MATARHTIGNLISVPLTMVKLSLMKVIYRNNLYYKGIQRFSPNVVINIDRKSKIKFGKRTSIHSRGRVSAVSGGEIHIKKNCSFNVGCILACRKRIEIGEGVIFGPNVMVYDHNHIMDLENGVKNSGFDLGDITIGDNTWIGAGTIILPNTNIGKNCVIAAGSVVKGNIPDNTRLLQKRESVQKNV